MDINSLYGVIFSIFLISMNVIIIVKNELNKCKLYKKKLKKIDLDVI